MNSYMCNYSVTFCTLHIIELLGVFCFLVGWGINLLNLIVLEKTEFGILDINN